ncbi:MAG: BTAD domain-containing putative transcriptional regulator [Ilumatobacter sp.]
MLSIRVLGPISAKIDGREVELRGAHQRRLLAILASAGGLVVSTDRLVDLMWEGEPPDAAIKTFRTYVARLRRTLEATGVGDGASIVVTEAPGYRLSMDATSISIDADTFSSAVDQASDSLAVGEPASAWHALNDALDVWSGPAYDEFAHEEWAEAPAIRLDELRLVARELRIRAQTDLGRHAEAVADAESLIAEHPLREAPRREQMVALYRSGRHAEALRAGRSYAAYLAEQTGLEPSPVILDVEAMIIAGDPRLDAPPTGKRLRGYLLEEPIAESALGVVYRARQPSIDRDVAVTVIPAELADDPAFVRGFESRAQAVAGLEHPGVVPIYDYWREPGGAHLVTRHYRAGTLAARHARNAVSSEEAWDIVVRVITALWAAHQRGVAHGNVGASSVWLDEQGDAVVGGFAMMSNAASHQGDLAALADLADSLIVGRGAEANSPAAEHLRQLVARIRAEGNGSVITAYDLLLDVDDLGAHLPTLASRVIGSNPFKGLAAFSEADAELFFGRSTMVDELDTMLRRGGVAALIGPSGSGKSSVMRAGLLPRHRAAGAFVTSMVPGAHPLDELEIALTRIAPTPFSGLAAQLATDDDLLASVLRSIAGDSGDDIVLAIDQFEEFFTISDSTERDRLLQVLVAALNDPTVPLAVAATCRADFMGRVLDHPVAGPLLRDRSVLITPLTSGELQAAVVGPAEHAGVAVEPALLAQIVGDAAGAPGSLPMVQYMLTEVFEAASGGGVMTLHDYQRLGGVSGGLAQQADEVFDALTSEDQAAATRLFVRLVAPGAASESTRRRALRSELTTIPNHVIDAFGEARLLSFDRDPATREPTVEVSHEALIRHWPRFVAWVDEASDGLRLLGHLTASSREWSQADRDPSQLYRGTRLDAVEHWVAERNDELSQVEAEFIASSVDQRNEEAARKRSSMTRLRGLTVALGVFLVLAVIAASLAISASQRADDRAAEADETRRVAEVAALAGNSRVLADTDPITAMLLAIEASGRSAPDEPVVASALLESLSADSRVRSLYPPVDSTGLVIPAVRGPFYSYLSTTETGARAEIVNVETNDVRTIDFDEVPGFVTTDPTGTWLYSGAGDRMLVYDIDTGDVVADQPIVDFFVSTAGPVIDGRDTIAAARPDGRFVVQTLPDFEVVSSIEADPDTAVVEISGDGRVAALVAFERGVVITPVDGSGERLELPLFDQVGQFALDTDGSRLAISGRTVSTFVIDLSDPFAEPLVIEAGADSDLEFSPNGELLAVATADGVEIYDTSTGAAVTEPLVFATDVDLHFSGERSLRAFAPSLGVVSIDLDAPSRVVDEVEMASWGVAAFVAPDRTGAITIVPDGAGQATEEWLAAPAPDSTVASEPLGPPSLTRGSRPIGSGRFITADTATLLFEERDGTGVVQTIDLAGDVTVDTTHFIAPRAGTVRDILVLAVDGEVLLGSEIVVVDREQGEVALTIAEPGLTVAEFARPDESEVIVGDIDGRVRWFGLDGSSSDDEVMVGSSVGSFAVTDDALRTAVGDWSGTVTILDADRQVVGEFSNDSPFPIRMVFTGDGDRLVVQSEDGSIVLWDIDTLSRIGTLYRTDGLRGAIELTSDGASILAPTGNGITEISIAPSDWVAIACESVNRRLTEVELNSVVPGLAVADDPCATVR